MPGEAGLPQGTDDVSTRKRALKQFRTGAEDFPHIQTKSSRLQEVSHR